MRWIKTLKGNEILKSLDDSFFVSYNSFKGTEITLWGDIFQSDNYESETALVKNGSCYILNGDFRKDYEDLIQKGWGECIKFFDSKPELHSSWSDK